MIKGKKGKGKAKRKTTWIEDLPADARSIWQSTVIPNLLFLLLSEEQPWEVSDDSLKKALTKVCDCAYGGRIKMYIEKGETAFELVTRWCLPFNLMLIMFVSRLPRFCTTTDRNMLQTLFMLFWLICVNGLALTCSTWTTSGISLVTWQRSFFTSVVSFSKAVNHQAR